MWVIPCMFWNTWMTVLYEKATGKDFKGDDAYVKFCDKFVDEFNKDNDLKLAIKKVMNEKGCNI